MKLELIRFHHGKDDTLGLLLIDGVFAAFTLEDEYRIEKIPGETRIPDGEYPLGFRNSPKFSKRYGHPMIEVKNIPNFTYVYIHPGNRDDDTDGCLLVGNQAVYRPGGNSELFQSKLAYDRLYPLIAKAIRTESTSLLVTNL